MKNLTVLGDVHGKYRQLHELLREKDRHPHVVHVGDLGFNYTTLENISTDQFRFVAGNHDNYDVISSVPHYLGDFGYVENFGGFSFFFYRGAWSIDYMYRTIGVSWWKDEQVSTSRWKEASEMYGDIKPDFVITHDCPEFIYDYLLPPWATKFNTYTPQALKGLYYIHKPKLWIFGHHHQSWNIKHEETEFRCLNELEWYKVPEELVSA